MGVVKLIIIVLLMWTGFWLLKKFKKRSDRLDQKSSVNKMLACSICKVHIPENEAIIQNNKVYCSKEHLE